MHQWQRSILDKGGAGPGRSDTQVATVFVFYGEDWIPQDPLSLPYQEWFLNSETGAHLTGLITSNTNKRKNWERSVLKRIWYKGRFIYVDGNVHPLWKMIWRVISKVKIELPDDQEIPLLGIYSQGKKKKKSFNKTHTLFTIHIIHYST